MHIITWLTLINWTRDPTVKLIAVISRPHLNDIIPVDPGYLDASTIY